MNKEIKNTANNTIMLYILAVVKLILPLVTLPYLTRVLTTDTYGVVSYVKACTTYAQLIIDFGFILSSVKDIVKANGDKEKIGQIAGHTFVAKTFLVFVSLVVMIILTFTLPILKRNVAFTLLSFGAVAVTAYMADFLFRGIEKMHIITIIFVIVKSVSTALTFVFVKNDSDLLLIPIFDIVSNVLSILISEIWIAKLGIEIRAKSIKTSFKMLGESFTYFLSSMATTVFSILCTVIIGIVITDETQIAYWGLCMQLISAVQGLYVPITNGVYPHMIRRKSLSFIHKILLLIMPIVTVGCVLCLVLSNTVLGLIGGAEYVVATPVFRCLVPILFLSFPAQLYGWPTLGAVGMVKQTTITTVIAAVVQVLGLVILMATHTLTLISVAILKCGVEFVLMLSRMIFTYKNRKKFAVEEVETVIEEHGEELTLEELKHVKVEILEDVLQFCKENGIRCWVSGGTALGAVRHQGFIPWDDNIDIEMPRKDYERFAKTYNDSSQRYFFGDFCDNGWYLQFGKVFDSQTVTQETVYRQLPKNGVYIDVFPVDGLGDDLKKAKKQARRAKKKWAVGERLFMARRFTGSRLKRFIKSVYKEFMGIFLSQKRFTKKFQQYVTKCDFDSSQYVGNISDGMFGERHALKREIYGEAVYLPFEEIQVPVPQEYDAYLTNLYGDYMTPPPEEERKPHHSFIAYWKKIEE